MKKMGESWKWKYFSFSEIHFPSCWVELFESETEEREEKNIEEERKRGRGMKEVGCYSERV